MLRESEIFEKNWKRRQRKDLEAGVDCAYLYVHLEADSGEPFYIGMGDTAVRPWNKKRTDKHKNRANKHGQITHVDASPVLTYDNALWWEVRWIKAFRDAGYNLVNLTDGGEGTKGWVPSEETRAKYRARSAGENNPNYGVPCSPEKAKKIGDALRGKPQRPDSEETKAKKSIAAKKREEKFGSEYRKERAKKRVEKTTFEERSATAIRGHESRIKNGNFLPPQAYMTTEQILDRAKKAAETRSRNGTTHNPSLTMSPEKLKERALKTAETKRRNKLLKEGIA